MLAVRLPVLGLHIWVLAVLYRGVFPGGDEGGRNVKVIAHGTFVPVFETRGSYHQVLYMRT